MLKINFVFWALLVLPISVASNTAHADTKGILNPLHEESTGWGIGQQHTWVEGAPAVYLKLPRSDGKEPKEELAQCQNKLEATVHELTSQGFTILRASNCVIDDGKLSPIPLRREGRVDFLR